MLYGFRKKIFLDLFPSSRIQQATILVNMDS